MSKDASKEVPEVTRDSVVVDCGRTCSAHGDVPCKLGNCVIPVDYISLEGEDFFVVFETRGNCHDVGKEKKEEVLRKGRKTLVPVKKEREKLFKRREART
jgi:hypothetical protein